MPDRVTKNLHVHSSVVAHYDSDDLELFESIIRDILEELSEQGSYLAAPENQAATKTELAIALFNHAEAGEHDPGRLKRLALGALTGDTAPRPAH